MSDCRFGVSPVNYPDPDPDPENAAFFSLRDHSEITVDAHACERNVRVPTSFPELFLSSLHIKLRWEMMKPNIKIERISLLLARIHRISAEIWLLPDDLRHLSVDSPNRLTQA